MSADATSVPQSTPPTRTLDSEELYKLNDQITAQLAERGWHAETEEDYAALDDLTHALAEHVVQINENIEAFIAKRQL